ncbi:unnamed protein product [Boreogadus saida]
MIYPTADGVEQVSQLSSLVESQVQYHRQAVQILEELYEKLGQRVTEAQSRPRREYTPKPKPTMDYGEPEQANRGYAAPAANPPSYSAGPSFRGPSLKNRRPEASCKALYDFEAENPGELSFREGDLITLTSRIDENWFEGTVQGRVGFFPNNYVEVVVPLSH